MASFSLGIRDLNLNKDRIGYIWIAEISRMMILNSHQGFPFPLELPSYPLSQYLISIPFKTISMQCKSRTFPSLPFDSWTLDKRERKPDLFNFSYLNHTAGEDRTGEDHDRTTEEYLVLIRFQS